MKGDVNKLAALKKSRLVSLTSGIVLTHREAREAVLETHEAAIEAERKAAAKSEEELAAKIHSAQEQREALAVRHCHI